ncbi:MAG: glycosyl hydrolase family 18 protein [Candidatus Dormibacteria bacterium]
MFKTARLGAGVLAAMVAGTLSATSGTVAAAASTPAEAPASTVQPHLAFDESDHPLLPGVTRGAPVTPLAQGGGQRRVTAGSVTESPNSNTQHGAPEVLGFVEEGEVLGNWQADLKFNLLSTVAYFSIDVNNDGSLDNDEGYQVFWSSQATALFNAAHAAGDLVVATFNDFSTSGIDALLNSSSAEATFIQNVVTQVTTRGVDGVNIDFEPVGDSGDAQAFTSLMSALQSALNSQAPGSSYLSVDTYASAYQGGEMYDIPNLAKAVDAIDVMTYVMNGPTEPNSPIAGPYGYTETSVVNGYLAEMPADKLLLGIPYFGEVYSTTSDAFNAPVADASQTLSPTYADILYDFSCVYQQDGTAGPVINWDGTSQTPWAYWYGPASNASCGSDYSTTRELYYDNAQSLEAKYGLVDADHLRGVGIWALGMDSGSNDLWNAIAASFVPLADPPTGVTATSTASDTATVSWSLPSDVTTDRVSGYAITTYNDKGVTVGSVQSVSGALTASAGVTGLTDGTPYYFSVASVNPSGTGTAAESNSVTPLSGTAPAARTSAASTQQYLLPNSDGSTWQVMDESNLSLEITPSSSENVLLSANSSLWTATATYDQDLGIEVTPAGGSPVLAAWKESGGSAGTYSPNAAYVETVYPMSAGTAYTVDLVWKTNKTAIGVTVAAGAGPIGSAFSPTQLTAAVLPAGTLSSASTAQYSLANNDGSSWQEIDSGKLAETFSPSMNEDAVISANADLWTENAGYNQDLGIFVSEDGAPARLLAWTETGGLSGTYSPSAAYVETVLPVTVGNTYAFSLDWKTNRAAPGATIHAGAGPIGGAFSPTRITVYPLPPQWPSSASNLQYRMTGSDGSAWQELDATNLAVPITPGSGETVVVTGNSPLFTTVSGHNQDLGIFVSVDGGTPQLLAWEESGGSAGTYSPNAATVETAYAASSGHTYVFSLWWKTNTAAPGVMIEAGAGPIGGAYSPTSLTLVP